MPVFQNQAFLSYNGKTTASNVVTGRISEPLTVTKTVLADAYYTGETLTYVVTLVNSGATPLTDLVVTDDLGAYTEGGTTLVPLTYVADSVYLFVDGTPATAPGAEAGPPLVLSGITVPAGGDATLIYNVTPNAYASPETGGSITNTVTVTGGGLTEGVTAEAAVTAAEGPILTIQKTASALTVNENDTLTYTFVIENSGNAPADAAAQVTVTDDLDPIFGGLVVTLGGVVWEATNYTYDTATGAFATTPGAITVPAATYTQDPDTGAYSVTPGTVTLTLSGTV